MNTVYCNKCKQHNEAMRTQSASKSARNRRQARENACDLAMQVATGFGQLHLIGWLRPFLPLTLFCSLKCQLSPRPNPFPSPEGPGERDGGWGGWGEETADTSDYLCGFLLDGLRERGTTRSSIRKIHLFIKTCFALAYTAFCAPGIFLAKQNPPSFNGGKWLLFSADFQVRISFSGLIFCKWKTNHLLFICTLLWSFSPVVVVVVVIVVTFGSSCFRVLHSVLFITVK